MSTFAKITLIGMYNFDNTLFDGLTLPEGYKKDDFIDSLILEHGEKCVLYSDNNYLKACISAWGRKWYLELSRIYEALTAEYNPIYNYDRFEEYTDKGSSTDKPDYESVNTQKSAGTVENQISADNSSSYQPESKSISDMGSISQTVKGTRSNVETELEHKAHLFGNIGVTTSAQMVTEVVEQRIKYNLYGTAAKLFANELLINVY